MSRQVTLLDRPRARTAPCELGRSSLRKAGSVTPKTRRSTPDSIPANTADSATGKVTAQKGESSGSSGGCQPSAFTAARSWAPESPTSSTRTWSSHPWTLTSGASYSPGLASPIVWSTGPISGTHAVTRSSNRAQDACTTSSKVSLIDPLLSPAGSI